MIRYQKGSPRSVFFSTASALDCPMLRTPLTRFAQCAVFVAAIISALIPPSSLACTHCLLHDVNEIAGHNSDCEHDHDEHSCGAPCTESNDSDSQGQHPDDNHHSHRDCPCCIGGFENALLLSGSVNRLANIATVTPAWSGFEYRLHSMMRFQYLHLDTSTRSTSLPNVLRI